VRILRYLDRAGVARWGVESADGEVLEAKAGATPATDGVVSTGRPASLVSRLAPVTPPNIYCIGLNYRDHAAETGAAIPERPVVFMKPTSTLNRQDGNVPTPTVCRENELDYEGELAVVLGRVTRDVTPEEALDCVWGYTIAMDISARWHQKQGGGGQWIRGKGFDGFCPLGPVLVTADELADPQALTIRTELNGEVVQDGRTSDMIFPVAELISFLSRDVTLLPGTAILTGTPSGVGAARNPPVSLAVGDALSVEIAPIGRLRVRVTGPWRDAVTNL